MKESVRQDEWDNVCPIHLMPVFRPTDPFPLFERILRAPACDLVLFFFRTWLVGLCARDPPRSFRLPMSHVYCPVPSTPPAPSCPLLKPHGGERRGGGVRGSALRTVVVASKGHGPTLPADSRRSVRLYRPSMMLPPCTLRVTRIDSGLHLDSSLL